MNDTIALTEATYYILLSLATPRHGYGIIKETEELSHGRVRLAAGTLYGALTALQDKEWIRLLPAEDGARKKEYQLTDRGRNVLEAEVTRLQELYHNGMTILGRNA